MSKLFDALQGSQGEISRLLPDLIPNEMPVEQFAAPPPPAVEPEPRAVTAGVTPANGPAMAAPVPQAYATPSGNGHFPRRVSLTVPSSAPLLPFEDPRARAAEQYRIARTRISHHPNRPQLVVVSSASPGDGKSLTAINLAGALALKNDAYTLLLDADFRRSTLPSLLGLPASPGLAEITAGQCGFEDAVVQAEQYPNLHILVSGHLGNENPSELLDSTRWHSLLQALRAKYRYIIIDSPPVGAVADFDLIQMAADATLLVVRPDHTKRSACLKAIETIPKSKFLGVILNCAQNWVFFNEYKHGYDYKYYEATPSNGKPAARAGA